MAEGTSLSFLNEKFLKTAVDLLLKLSGPIFVICLIVLVPPKGFAEWAGVLHFREAYRQWLGLAMIVTGVLFCSNWLHEIKEHREKGQHERRVLDRLTSCSKDELSVLGMCLERNSPSITINPFNYPEAVAAADQLATKRLLIHTPGSMNVHTFSYTMPDFVWKHLKENASLSV